MTTPTWLDAVSVIGSDGSDDYVLTPTGHSTRYETTAPGLVALLRSTAATIAAEEFERADAIALDAQRQFRRVAGQANLVGMLAAWLSAAVLLAALLDAAGPVLLATGIGGSVVGAYGVFLMQRLRQQHLLQRWMTARAEAEEFRHRYFEVVTLTPPQNDVAAGAPSTSMLQLEYFRRYQLDVQSRYYDIRQRQHQRSSDRTITYAAAAAFTAALSTGLAGLLGAGEGTDWAGLAALGIVGASIATYAGVRESITQDSRNAERYGRTRAALREVHTHLDEVREAVSHGNRAALEEFVAAVHEHLSVEHRQWLTEADATRTGLARLERALRGEHEADPAQPGMTPASPAPTNGAD
ncbi:MAG: hypothetical protein O2822_04840 [Chloroflexi bacterium]|nr:hypothetical protein [Chloroflexota bacterium]